MGQNIEKGVAGHFHRLHNSRWEVQTCWIILNIHKTKVHGSFIRLKYYIIYSKEFIDRS